jgi:hypothetical protein
MHIVVLFLQSTIYIKQINHKTMKYKILLVSLLLFCANSLFGQFGSIEDFKSGFEEFNKRVGIEKVYLHFDKSDYDAGDNIWFKAYLLDDKSNSLPEDSLNLYVDFIDSRGNIVENLVMLAVNGTAWGGINLFDSMPEGNYKIRAYTDRMLQYDKGSAYEKHFYIHSFGYENFIPQSDIRLNKRLNKFLEKKSAEFSLFLFPEGGNLVEGLVNRIAFKASDGLGKGISLEGEVLDSKGNIVEKFSAPAHGYGTFKLKPLAGDTYKVRAYLGGSSPKDFALPELFKSGYVMHLTYGEKTLNMSISASPSLPVSETGSLYLVIHNRGTIEMEEIIEITNGSFAKSYNLNDFSDGINQLTLFNKDFVPIAQRLFFVNPREIVSFNANLFFQEHEKNKFLQLVLQSTDQEGNPVQGNYSLSVQSGDFTPVNSSENILNYMTISSELKGVNNEITKQIYGVDNPEEFIDLLMLTHGWRRFSLNDLLKKDGQIVEKTFPPGLIIKGKLFDPVSRQYLPNYPVQLTLKGNYNKSLKAVTNPDGEFVFDNLLFEGPLKIELFARRTPGGGFPIFEVSNPERRTDITDFVRANRITEKGTRWKKPKANARFAGTGNETMDEPKSLYGSPDQTIVIDSRLVNYRSILHVLQDKAVGFTIQDGQINFRGPSSVMLSSSPIFMLDGSMIDQSAFMIMSPSELQRIEIFKGANTAIFGVRGTNGAIIGYSRRYSGSVNGTREMVVQGFHTPVDYYDNIVKTNVLKPGVNYTKTIQWDPLVKSNENGEAINIFPFPDGISRFKVIIEGVAADGKIGFGEFIYEFRK